MVYSFQERLEIIFIYWDIFMIGKWQNAPKQVRWELLTEF